MALDLEMALEIARFSEDAPLIKSLVREITRLQEDTRLHESAILRLSTDLAYAEARAEKLQSQNAELVRAVVNASAEGLIDIDVRDSE